MNAEDREIQKEIFLQKRRMLRERIFQLLFCSQFHSADEIEFQTKHFIDEDYNSEMREDDAAGAPEWDKKSQEMVSEKFQKILEKIEEIDALINQKTGEIDARTNPNAKSWKTERMGKVDLALIRIGVYEIVFDEKIPTGVAINEAVELAKKFGQDESPAFVNGILARFA